MWKVQLFCDTCNHAHVEGINKGSRDALVTAKDVARSVGWAYVRNVGWTCARCIERPHVELGDRAYYIGSIVTPTHVALKGMEVRILSRDPSTRTVHAMFVDPSVGRWAQQAHWFFEYDFSPQPLEDANGSDGRQAPNCERSPDSIGLGAGGGAAG